MKTQKFPANAESESDIQKAVINRLQQHGFLVMRLNSGASQVNGRYVPFYRVDGLSAGAPDLLAFKGDCTLVAGRCLMIEMKKASGRLSESQKAFRVLAKQRGLTVHVVRSVAEVEEIIKEMKP